LAVARGAQKLGVGRLLMNAVETEARELGLHALFAFTYVDGFFNKMGYEVCDRGELPLKVWRDCIKCPKFHKCDEIAVIKRLSNECAAMGEVEDLMDLVQIELPVMRK
jgi:amino-acid N-acetyltransferase